MYRANFLGLICILEILRNNPSRGVWLQCTILDQIPSVAEGLSLVKIGESFRTWESPVGHAHSTNFFICYGLTLFKMFNLI